MAAVNEPVQIVAPPSFRRDHLVHAWIGVKALSDAGNALWMIALAWTAVQVASPAVAGLIVAAGPVPRAAILLFGGVLAAMAGFGALASATALWVPSALFGGAMMALMILPLSNETFPVMSLRAEG